MKTKILILLLCCCCSVCVAQEAIRQDSVQSKKNSFRHWQIGASFSPDALLIEYLDASLMGRFSFTTGLHAVYKINNYLGVETGIFFANKKFICDEYELDIPIYHYTLQYIDVPIRLNYYFGKGKLRGFATVGAAANFRQCQRINSHYYDELNNESFSDVIKSTNFSAFIGVGMECKLSDRFTLRAVPITKFGIKEESIDYAPDVRFWSVGAEIGFFYEIK